MKPDDRGDDAEPQPGPGPGLVPGAAVEAPQHRGALVVRHARSGVADLDARPLGLTGQSNLDPAPGARAVLINGESVRLSHREYALAALLAGRPGEVISLQEILQSVWGDEEDPRPEAVHTYISRLRAKLERGRPWKLLHAVRGHGYRFNIET